MKFSRGRGGAAGFSLVEVALSLAILAVGMTGVLALLPVGLDSARQVHAETVAAQVVRQQIGELSLSNRVAGAFVLPQPTNRFFLVDGQSVEEQDPRRYFQISFQTNNTTANSCRYFLRLAWPAVATNLAARQQRVFVSEQMRSW